MKTHGKDLSLFDKGRIIELHGVGKTICKINEETGVGCRTIQQTLAYWKQYGEPSSSHSNCGRGKILSERDRCSLKRLVKKNCHSSVQMITSEFNEGTKKYHIFPYIRDPFLLKIFTLKIGGLLYVGVSLLAPVCIVVQYAGMHFDIYQYSFCTIH